MDAKVVCPSCNSTAEPDPPVRRRLLGIIGALGLGFIGLLMGLSVGVATAGFGTVAAIFTVPLGLYFGYKLGTTVASWIDGTTCPECGHAFEGDLSRHVPDDAADRVSNAADTATERVRKRRSDSSDN